jgi:nucleoside-diphosphate kinase
MPEIQRTFVMIKPDGVERLLVGEIIRRFESKGLKLTGMKMVHVSEDLAGEHYRDHQGKPFFPSLVEFVRKGPVVALALEGVDAVARVRQMMGALDPNEALPGTIRGDFALERQMNLIHGSDSPESAARELALWFREDELMGYTRVLDEWVSSS